LATQSDLINFLKVQVEEQWRTVQQPYLLSTIVPALRAKGIDYRSILGDEEARRRAEKEEAKQRVGEESRPRVADEEGRHKEEKSTHASPDSPAGRRGAAPTVARAPLPLRTSGRGRRCVVRLFFLVTALLVSHAWPAFFTDALFGFLFLGATARFFIAEDASVVDALRP